MSAAQAVYFKIEGEWLTETARNRVIEDRFDHGFNILYEGLCGISSDQVLSILKGDAKLVGTNEVDMVFEEDLKWKAQLDYFYAGTWVTPTGRYMQPYAVVTSWGSDDMANAENINADSDSQYSYTNTFSSYGSEMMGRSLFYADDPKLDAAKHIRYESDDPDIVTDHRDGCVTVLFKEVRNYPSLLIKPFHGAQEAFDVWIKHHNLVQRGYAQSFPNDRYKIRWESADVTELAPITKSHEDFDAEGRKDYKKNLEFKQTDVKQIIKTIVERKKSIEEYREKIIERANGNFIDFTYCNFVYKIPRAPFENWCLWRTDGAHLALPWEKVCPSGLKMMGDDPYHTDFLIGAGFEPDAMLKDEELNSAIFSLHREVQEEKLGFKCAVLSGRGYVHGTVVHVITGEEELPDDAIVVTKNAAAKHLDAVLKARAVIVERGGAMAHLVTLARETEAVIVRIGKALTIYPNGSSVTINADKGEVTLHEGDMKSIWKMFGE